MAENEAEMGAQPEGAHALERGLLEAWDCWEASDRVPRDPAMTEFRRRTRLQQAVWRHGEGFPAGTQPINPGSGSKNVRAVGSRLPLEFARDSAANFISFAAVDAARTRAERIEPHQSFDRQRFWADLLSSQALAVNLFACEPESISEHQPIFDHALPDFGGAVGGVRFAYSPGRLDPAYLNSLRDFSAVITAADEGRRAVVAVRVLFHERNKAELPRPSNLDRYRDVAERSGVFRDGAIDELSARSDLCVMWLEHLLLLSMLQHHDQAVDAGVYLVVHPEGNPHAADATERYGAMLSDRSTFDTMTIERLLELAPAIDERTPGIRRRYLTEPEIGGSPDA